MKHYVFGGKALGFAATKDAVPAARNGVFILAGIKSSFSGPSRI
jgi:hypothetical protein